MTPLALQAKVAPPPPSSPPAHASSAASTGEPSFAAVLKDLDAPDVKAGVKGRKSESGAEAQDSTAIFADHSQPNPVPSFSIEAALAALGYPSSAPPTDAAPSGHLAATAAPFAIVPASRGSAPPPSALAEKMGAAAQTGQSTDPTLGLQSVRSRTHLAVTDARPAPQAITAINAPPAAHEKGAESQPFARANSQTQVAPSGEASNIIGVLGSAGGPSPVSPRAEGSPTTKSWAASRTKGAPASQPVPTGARGLAAPEPGSPGERNAVSRNSGDSISRDGSKSGGDGASILGPGATLAMPNAVPGLIGPAPIGVNQLANFIATEAASLTPDSAPTAGPQTSAYTAPQSVKELEIALDPAELGAVSIRMRLANGKLTVVIGAARASTRLAIESDREAIADRLTSGQQPLEALIIKSEGPTQVPSGGSDASDANDPGQNPANGNSASDESRAGGGAQSGRGRSANAALKSAAATSRGGSGDLMV